MKKSILFILLFVPLYLSLSAQSTEEGETLMTIGDENITVSEFLRIYNKNNSIQSGETVEDKKSVEEYLDLFINFKLKVLEAENKGLDTAASFQRELSGYREQLAKSYLVDEDVVDSLVIEAYERMQQEVRASHILVLASPDASPEDTLAAYKKIKEARKRILKGEDFEKVALEVSEDRSVERNGGDLGYFTTFKMIYPFESAAYNTPVGELTEPFRTRFGYHIIKVTDKRPAQGEVKVAHIMVTVPKDADEATKEAAKNKIDSLEKELEKGADFEELAKKHSDHRISATRGGELQWFGTGRMVPSFENAAFNLDEKGDYSEPVRTGAGWHILKLIDKRPLKSFEELKPELKTKVSRDSRSKISKEKVVTRLKEKYNYTKVNSLERFYEVVDTTIFEGKWDMVKAKELDNVLFTLTDPKTKNTVEFTEQDFAQVLADIKRRSKKISIPIFVDKQFNDFVRHSVIEFEKERLEDYYPEFRYLMQEYHDGILLFDLMEQMVWKKAVEDSVGLEQYYQEHKNEYMWNERVDISVFNYGDEESLEKLIKYLNKKQKKDWSDAKVLEKINKKDTTVLKSGKSGLYGKGKNKYADKIFSKLDENEEKFKEEPYIIIKDENIVLYLNEKVPPQPKKLKEVRGLVTADYQTFLEKKWIESLREKYKVKINEEVLNKIK